MGRFNAELDDELHQQFINYAKARGMTMKQIMEELLRGLLAKSSSEHGGVDVVEIRLGPNIQCRVEQSGSRVLAHVTGQQPSEDAGNG